MTGILNTLIAGVSGAVKDAYFNLVSLLLPGNGTNGAQNNTFLDSSSNNFTITRNGDTTQGTFSPFSQTGWGAYFDGSNDYVSMPDSSAFSLSSSNWTMECWVYPTTSSANRGIAGHANSTVTASSSSFIFYLTSTNQVGFELYSGSSSYVITTTTTVAYNQWSHIAAVRDGNTARVYINGQQATGGTVSVTGVSINDSAAQFAIGRPGEYNSWYCLGNMSNFRLVNGTCLYPNGTQFTPSTTPLTTTSQGATSSEVKLLTLQNNRFIDNAATPNTLTPNNGVAITPFSPFAPTSSYSAAAVGGSGYFDGTGDSLQIADTTELELGASNFTIEAWIYATATPGASGATIIGKNSATYPGGYEFNLVLDNARTLSFNVYTSTLVSLQGTTVIPLNAWTHVAASRSGSDYAIYVNGTREDLDSAGGTIQSTTSNIYIGDYGGGSRNLTGYIASLRVVKGSYVYNPSSTNVTIPTAPLTAITDTKLLLNFTNAGVVDATAKNVLETVGNAQISTTQSKWGGGSMRFPQSGTNDYLYKPYDPLLNQVNGNFTIECWIYPTVTSTRMIFAGLADAAGDSNWFWEITSGNKLAFIWTNTTPTVFTATSTASISPNTWTYIAVVKNGGTITQYINGSTDGTSSPTGTYRNGSYGFGIGRAGDYNGLYFTGYIDDFRMTIGQARTITASPSAPFPVQ